jgi:hypothetical protein
VLLESPDGTSSLAREAEMVAVLMAVGIAAALGFLVVAGPVLVDRLRARRAQAVARQIALTDALDAALGPILTPAVHRRPWGPWEIHIAVRFAQPAAMDAIFAAVDDLFGNGGTDSRPYRLTLQAPDLASSEPTKHWASAA